MAVVVVLDIDETLREQHSLTIEVRSDDVAVPVAVAALRQALLRLEATGAGGERVGLAVVSSPIILPGAQLLVIDLGPLPAEHVLAIPELLVRQLRDAGVRDALVSVARRGPSHDIEEFGVSARAYLRGPLGAPFGDAPCQLPPPLLNVALDWLHAERGRADELSAVVLGVQVPLTAEAAGPATAAVLSTLPTAITVTLLAGDLTNRLVAATVGGYHDVLPAAAFSVARPRDDPADLAGPMHRLRDKLRAHSGSLVWAGVDAAPDSRRVSTPQWSQRLPSDEETVTRRPGVEMLADVLIPDAMWYQILSAGHLDRLGGLPPGAKPLPGRRAELTVGDAEQWLPGHPDALAVLARGRELLAGCLVDEAQAWQMTAARIRRAAPPGGCCDRPDR
ncbi:hypothetical protein GA0070607_6174 [Micromonospora coriariae]|uniref:Uncharacterized protein n=1 Tax=Micromonospora coriariae TaxID=285665 RepID=A0A1C4Y2Z2_9ACTN|nr:hypothetical protein [Micromonospora coriariae]SCF15099.1 hypothetical protein GA0070607_6174 [Micromonospora coriariae]